MTYLRAKKEAFQSHTTPKYSPKSVTPPYPAASKPFDLGTSVDRDAEPSKIYAMPQITSSSTLRPPEGFSSGAGRMEVEPGVSEEPKREDPGQLERLTLNLNHLHRAKLDPPVTKVALSELDLERIINNPQLRHDVNFDSIVAFRPNEDRSQSRRKAAEAKIYWDALAAEVELYINQQGQTQQDAIDERHGIILRLSPKLPLRTVLMRLPRMFMAIHEILQTLIPRDQWATIEAHLNINQLGQELENGVCDFVGLIQWLGSMLIGSCSPLRDNLISEMAAKLRRGVCNNDPQTIVDGLRSLFGILEMMRLDIANHQIRYLRLFMIEDTVHFEQRYFRKMIADGWNLARAHAWYQAPVNTPASDADSQDSKLLAFAGDIVDMVVLGHTQFPATFAFDYKRLQLLQAGFQECKQQEIYAQVFCKVAKRRGWTAQIPPKWIHSLLRRTYILRDHEKTEMKGYTPIDSIALEIFSETAKLCHLPGLPNDRFLSAIEADLQELSITTSSSLEDWDHPLCYKLAEMVEQKVTAIMGLNPLEMQNYFLAKIPKVELGPVEAALDEIAKTIAHIAVLHWRVWVPILYETHTDNDDPQRTTSSLSKYPIEHRPELQAASQQPNPSTQHEESTTPKNSTSHTPEDTVPRKS